MFEEAIEPGGLRDEPIPSVVLLLGVCVFSFLGVVAGIQVGAELDLPAPERLSMGLALECVLLVLTRGVHTSLRDGEARFGSWVIMSLYLLLLLSIGGARLSGTIYAEGALTAEDVGAAILLVFAAAGPTWIAEALLRLWLDSVPNRRIRRLQSRADRSRQRSDRAARVALGRLGEQQRAWDREHARLKAIYDAAFASTTAKLEQGPAPDARRAKGGTSSVFPDLFRQHFN